MHEQLWLVKCMLVSVVWTAVSLVQWLFLLDLPCKIKSLVSLNYETVTYGLVTVPWALNYRHSKLVISNLYWQHTPQTFFSYLLCLAAFLTAFMTLFLPFCQAVSSFYFFCFFLRVFVVFMRHWHTQRRLNGSYRAYGRHIWFGRRHK